MVKKILVTGYPHSGTTILRAKIGECKDTHDSHREFPDPPDFHPNMPFKFYVWKHPFLHTEFRDHTFAIKPKSKFVDTIVIPIIRNPWYVFTSLYERSLKTKEFSIYDFRQGHSLPWYENACSVIYDAMQNNYEDVYPLRYEDMFENNFEKLKGIFNQIGLEYDEENFYKKNKKFLFNGEREIKKPDTETYSNDKLRMWQINQSFENMNKLVNLPEDFLEMLDKSEIIKEMGYSNPFITN